MDDTYLPSPIRALKDLRVLLIQAEWPARALLKAELEGRGCEVLAASTPSQARSFTTAHGFHPSVVVLDALDLAPAEADILVNLLVPRDYPLIVLASTQRSSQVVTKLSPEMVLRRPFSIGNVVDAVLEST